MARPCPTITLRRKRILRDAGLLLLSLAVLLVLFSFPYLTREQALWALKKQYFFDGSRVVAWAEDPDPLPRRPPGCRQRNTAFSGPTGPAPG